MTSTADKYTEPFRQNFYLISRASLSQKKTIDNKSNLVVCHAGEF